MNVHPKTSGAAVGSALGVLIVAILTSIHGVHLSTELPAAITGFLAIFGAWIAPGAPAPTVPVTPVTSNAALLAQQAALTAREQALAAREAVIQPPPH